MSAPKWRMPERESARPQTPPTGSLPDVREQLATLTRYWTTFSDGMFDLEPAPNPENGKWVRYVDVLPIIEQREAQAYARGKEDAKR